MRRILSAWALAALLGACGEEAPDKPYLAFAGGGFIFNYNLAEAYYGFVVRVTRRLPDGAILEAEFEDPAGGAAIVVRQPVLAGRADYTFRTPSIQGVEAGRDYRVDVRLLDGDTQETIAAYGRTFRSSADQSILPKAPTTVGPGYQLNPDSELLQPGGPPPAPVGSGDRRVL